MKIFKIYNKIFFKFETWFSRLVILLNTINTFSKFYDSAKNIKKLVAVEIARAYIIRQRKKLHQQTFARRYLCTSKQFARRQYCTG